MTAKARIHPRLTDRILARHEPRGASTSTISPATRPTRARPSGDSGETLLAPMNTRNLDFHGHVIFVADLDDRANANLAGIERRRVDEHRIVEPHAQPPNARLEQALRVLRGVVLGVLRQVAVLARCLDRLNRLSSRRALEFGEFVGQRLALRRGQLVDSWLAQGPKHRLHRAPSAFVGRR